MTKPFLRQFDDGDDDSYSWSGRIPKGANQFLLDLMAEENLPNKSQTIKLVVQFAWTWYVRAAELTGHEISGRLQARLEFDAAQRDANERQDVLTELNKRLALIHEIDHPPTRYRLIATAKHLAETHGMDWPPKSLPLIAYDEDAAYVRDRIMNLVSRSDDGRVSLRDLVMQSVGDTAKILPVIERLAEQGYIEVYKEHRSGPPTVWIAVPSVNITQNTEKETESDG